MNLEDFTLDAISNHRGNNAALLCSYLLPGLVGFLETEAEPRLLGTGESLPDLGFQFCKIKIKGQLSTTV